MTKELLDISNNPVQRLATELEKVAAQAIAQRGTFSFALSGGSTPKALFELLASPEWKPRFDWRNTVLLFGDDRAVGPEDELSNFKMANDALLQYIDATVYRMEGERPDLEAAASEYEAKVRALSGPIDVILLGLGDDGHTASLFPASPQLTATDWVAATPVASMEPHVRRLTFTFPLINEARYVWFLATGAKKAERLQQVLQGPMDVQKLPSQGVAPVHGELKWFIDEPLAQLMK